MRGDGELQSALGAGATPDSKRTDRRQTNAAEKKKKKKRKHEEFRNFSGGSSP